MDTINLLLHDPKFWGALLALVNAILVYFVPDFPPPIWAGINALCAVIFAALAVPQARAAAAQRKLEGK
jgi:hypothetical protein